MLKKHLKKIVSLVLVTMMAIGMSITAIAAEPYQNELEAVMDTSPADSGQVTHYDTTTGEMLVEDGELLTFDEVAIPVPKGSADTPSERGIEIYLVRAGIKKTSGGEFTWYFNVDCPTSPFATVYKGNIIKNLIMDCQSYTKYRPNETTGGIFVSWRRKEELPTGA